MYRIQAVDSLDAVAAIQATGEEYAPVPSSSTWLDPNHISLMMVGPEGPVGAVLLVPCRHIGVKAIKYRLEWLLVRPDRRGRGFGRRLAQAAAAIATERGASTIHISVKPNNHHGLSWSENLPKVAGIGFVVSLDRCGL